MKKIQSSPARLCRFVSTVKETTAEEEREPMAVWTPTSPAAEAPAPQPGLALPGARQDWSRVHFALLVVGLLASIAAAVSGLRLISGRRLAIRSASLLRQQGGPARVHPSQMRDCLGEAGFKGLVHLPGG